MWFCRAIHARRKKRYLFVGLVILFVFGVWSWQSMTSVVIASESMNYLSEYDEVALDDGSLNSMRGGFVTADGIEIHIGIERLSYINDVLQTRFSLDLSSLGNRVRSSTGATSHAGGVLFHGGPRVDTAQLNALMNSGLVNVIQNTLDGQRLGNVTAIDIDIRNIGRYSRLDTLQSLEMEISHSLGGVR